MCTSVQDENYEHSLYISDIRSNYEKRGVDSLVYIVPRARVVGIMLLCLGSLMHRVMLLWTVRAVDGGTKIKEGFDSA